MESAEGASEAEERRGWTPDVGSGPENGAKGEAKGASPRGPTCCRCSKVVTGQYYNGGGLVWCSDCTGRAKGALGGQVGFGVFIWATALGYLAAVFAGGLWAVITASTGYQLGIVAVVVGLMVGHAVRVGGCRRRGRVLQLLAVALTFLGLSYSTVSFPLRGFREAAAFVEELLGREGPDEANRTPGGAGPEESVTVPGSLRRGAPVSVRQVFTVLLHEPVQRYVLSLKADAFSLLFLAIALWEAWKINRPVSLAFLGPFEISPDIDFDHVDFAGS